MEKRNKIIYWVATGLLAFGMLASGLQQLFLTKEMVDMIAHLGYPLYFMRILGVWKILGVIAILIPGFKFVKEWAYAGFVFDFVGAAWCHFAVQGFGQGVTLVIPITVVAISYFTYHRLNDQPRLSTPVAEGHAAQ